MYIFTIECRNSGKPLTDKLNISLQNEDMGLIPGVIVILVD
jgi:hypothetical protein